MRYGLRDAVPIITLVAIVAVIVVVVALTLGPNSRNAAVRNSFSEDCLSNHPDAHVNVFVTYSGRTYYCLGPNGEIWSVQ
jgi:hypothetical protein